MAWPVTAIPEQVPQFRLARTWVERHADCARADGRQAALQRLDAVVKADGHPVAPAQLDSGEMTGQPAGALCQPGIRDPAPGIGEGESFIRSARRARTAAGQRPDQRSPCRAVLGTGTAIASLPRRHYAAERRGTSADNHMEAPDCRGLASPNAVGWHYGVIAAFTVCPCKPGIHPPFRFGASFVYRLCRPH